MRLAHVCAAGKNRLFAPLPQSRVRIPDTTARGCIILNYHRFVIIDLYSYHYVTKTLSTEDRYVRTRVQTYWNGHRKRFRETRYDSSEQYCRNVCPRYRQDHAAITRNTVRPHVVSGDRVQQ